MPPAPGVGERADSLLPLSDDLRIDVTRALPTRLNAPVAAASALIGGPVGVHAAIGRSRMWTPLRAVLLMALVIMALSWSGKAGCLQQAPVPGQDGQPSAGMRLNWDNQRQYYGLCYSEVIARYGTERLTIDDLRLGTMPYRTYWFAGSTGAGNDVASERHYLDQPVVIGAVMYIAAKATQGWQALIDGTPIPRQLDVVTYFNLTALLLVIFWLIAVWATMMTDRRRLWLGALLALSPLVALHAFTAYDVIPVALVALAILFWTRRNPVPAGIFAGLAVASALYPLLLIPALGVIAFRERRTRELTTLLSCAGLAWIAVNLPVVISYPRGWSEFFRTWWQRAAEPDSLYALIERTTAWSPPTVLVNAVFLALLVAVIAAVSYVALRAERIPTVAELMFLLVAGYLLVGKAWSPQSSLWLVPFAVLAVPYLRLVVAWMVVDALIWVPRMGLFLDPDRKWLPPEFFDVAVIVRAAFVLVLCVVVVRQLLHRHDDDPASGPPTGVVLSQPARAVPVG
ncbi:glycosyltransferase family 87 protein [Gordonia sp. (in: high G+C Gram-positive bacteria)]|uniref:glycosyltransferase family 87 protein n=1 Tax=Gordonia sp. (in: high G+C Gram-positive bacteria) TaxID=84139 RepID=UPI003BB4FE02